MTFINLFFVPALSVYIFFRLSKEPLRLNAKLVLLYMINTSVVAFLTKSLMLLIKFLFGFERIYPGGNIYFLATFIVSLIVPVVANAFIIKTKEK